jgi:mitogen-activated protein kinase kinase 1 interacting protein 1
VEGLEAIIVTDSDGVLILEVSTKDFPQNMLKSNYLAMFGIATEKGSKLGFGTNKTISAFYSGHQVVQSNYPPLIVTLVAKEDTNTGLLYSIDIKDGMRELIQALSLD